MVHGFLVAGAEGLASEFDHDGALRIGIADGDLAGLEDKAIFRSGALEEGHGAFDAEGLADDGADHDDDDAEVGEEKAGVMFFPRPTGEGAADEVGGEEKEPEVEPGSFVDPSAGGVGVEFRLGQGADDAHDDERGEQNDGKTQ